ncbi:hypothetical protein [Streptomyces sp. NPDC018352]|uniref:hypothetical protein n=1 Tax=Streptomyces sp. NPDC018352 TaxID=3157194 RepID=UPI0033FC27ED
MQFRARPRTKAVAWQTLPPELTRAHLERLDREVLLFDGGQVRCGGAPALAGFLGSSPYRRYRLLGRCLRLPPISLAAHAIYRTVGGHEPTSHAGRYSGLRTAPHHRLKAHHAPCTHLHSQQHPGPPGQPRSRPRPLRPNRLADQTTHRDSARPAD